MNSGDTNIKTSKFSERDTRIIVAQLYVARKLNVSPEKVIKFILSNREYFPFIDDSIIESIIKEKGLSWEYINQLPEIPFADINDEGVRQQQ